METDDTTKEGHRARSSFIRDLVQSTDCVDFSVSPFDLPIQKLIVQFWNDMDRLPADVKDCLETWKKAEEEGFKRVLFDSNQAGKFIDQKLGNRHKRAYDKCYHPAMQSDYFRLCYIFVEGGCYVDADDIFEGTRINYLFNDSRLKIQPLCYDLAMNSMVPTSEFTKPGVNNENWIFYFNNNPLIAGSGHPLVGLALSQATKSLEKDLGGELPEIQSTTGPGNLTKTIFDALSERSHARHSLLVLCDWEATAKSRWELSYRNDFRNWRLSNCRRYNE